MRVLGQIIAVIFAIAFFFATIAVVFFHAVGTRIFQPQIYKDTLAKEQVYTRFPTIMAESVNATIELQMRDTSNTTNAETRAMLEAVRQIPRADWETIFGAVASPEYLQRQMEGSVDQFFGYLHSGSAALGAKISLVEVKQRLTGLEAENAYTKILLGKPPCTDQQFSAAGGLPIACRPSPDQMPQVLENFHKVMGMAAGEIPDEIEPFTKLREFDGPEQQNAKFAEIRRWIAKMELWAKWSPAVPAVLLALVVLCGARSIRGLLLWCGIPCLLAGAMSAIIAFPSVPVANWVFRALILPRFPMELPKTTIDTVFGVMTGAVQEVLSAALRVGLILAACGLGAMILAKFFRKKPA